MPKVDDAQTYGPRQANLVLIAYASSEGSGEPGHPRSESRGTFRQKAKSLAPLNGWPCAVKICHNGMLEDTNSLDEAYMLKCNLNITNTFGIGKTYKK